MLEAGSSAVFRTSETCQFVLESLCTSNCQTDSTLVLPTSNPVLEVYQLPDGVECTGNKGVKSTQWTQGWGGSWDILTEVRVTMNAWYGCSDDKSYADTTDGRCRWADWNGWIKDSCVWNHYHDGETPQEGVAQKGVKGEFHCYNHNFCYSDSYQHNIHPLARITNSGTGYCIYDRDGMMPPYEKTDCKYV